MKFKDRLVQLRKELNLTQTEFAEKIGFSRTAISAWEIGRNEPSNEDTIKIADFFGVSVDYIIGNSNIRKSYVPADKWIDESKYKKEINPDGTISYKAKFEPIPVIGKIAAGQPILAQENIEGYLPVDPNIYGLTSTDDLFYLLVAGQSMNMKVKNGDYALIHKQDYAEDGDIVVAIVNGDDEATLKRYKKLNDQFVLLEPMSTDPSIEAITVDLKNTNFKIIGKAIGQFGKF